MKEVLVLKETSHYPYTLAGKCAGECWGADTSNDEKNKKRGKKCFENGHMRTAEFPQVFLIIDGYSARVIREFYTHIGGGPTRLQASTRYINYDNFKYITPPSILADPAAKDIYEDIFKAIQDADKKLTELGIPNEDIANILPLGMETRIVVRTNLRNLIDMSHQRLCSRAYWEYRQLMKDIMKALSDYDEEWADIIKTYFQPKCALMGYCPENNAKCHRKPNKKS